MPWLACLTPSSSFVLLNSTHGYLQAAVRNAAAASQLYPGAFPWLRISQATASTTSPFPMSQKQFYSRVSGGPLPT